ncbi:MAG: hypothetical protein ACRDX8_11100 [Acidimicrobiales bacterium]
MGQLRWSLVLGSALLALGAASCAAGSAAPPGATVPTAVVGAPPPNPYAVPAVITKPYVQKVLNALEGVEAKATVDIAAHRAFTPTAAELIRSVTTPSELSVEQTIWLKDIQTGLHNIPAHPGPIVDSVQQVFPSKSACIFASAIRHGASAVTGPPPVHVSYFVLCPLPVSESSGGPNPTPWVINQVGYNSQGLQRGSSINVAEGQMEGTIRYKVSGATPGSQSVRLGGKTPAPAQPLHSTTTTATSRARTPTTTPTRRGPTTTTTTRPKPSATPAQVAASVWVNRGTNLLPSPHPYIAPGKGLAGLALAGYLEVRAPLSATFSDPTRLGTLSVAASAVVYVNWGDGTPTGGPYHSAGGPYPNGTITHYWDHDGTYTITVSEDWTATWTLAGHSGTLSGLQTYGRIPSFPVG